MRQWIVDAFAAAPFKGNPACVLQPLDTWPADAWMQSLAAENNQAETAFLLRTADPARFGLRWFTPKVEVPLCGHATLAAAHVLFDELGLDLEAITFDTRSGPLVVRRQADLYEMDFPARQPRRVATPPGLAAALGVEVQEVWDARFFIAVVADEAAVHAAKPDFGLLKRIETGAPEERGNVGVVAVADAGRPYDVVSRFFVPGFGIDEDPTTGAWHTGISPLFSGRLGRAILRFHQAYPGRGGDLDCEHRGERVMLRGQATTIAESIMRVGP